MIPGKNAIRADKIEESQPLGLPRRFVVGRVFAVGQEPKNDARPETEHDPNRHCQNAPEFIVHISGLTFKAFWEKVKTAPQTP